MEKHLEGLQVPKNFKCDQCEQCFHTKWRLKKHMELHTSNENRRKCHFFNAGKVCPYESLGCKFDHKLGEICKYGKEKCKAYMCQFRH